MKKKQKTFHNNRGSISVEASILFPIIILVIFFVLYAFMYIFNRELIRGDIYEAIYTIPLEDDGEYIEKCINEDGVGAGTLWCGREDVNAAGANKNGAAEITAKLEMKGETKISGKTEYDLCTDRLRRWQLYGDITEE